MSKKPTTYTTQKTQATVVSKTQQAVTVMQSTPQEEPSTASKIVKRVVIGAVVSTVAGDFVS